MTDQNQRSAESGQEDTLEEAYRREIRRTLGITDFIVRLASRKNKSYMVTFQGDTPVFTIPRYMCYKNLGRTLERDLVELKTYIREEPERRRREKEKLDQRVASGAQEPLLTREEINELAQKALNELPPIAHKYAAKLGVRINRITIKLQKTRWGSCSSLSNLNFNLLIMLLEPRLQEAVVLHEVCHMLEMNHSKAFYQLCESQMSDYRQRDAEIRKLGSGIFRRVFWR